MDKGTEAVLKAVIGALRMKQMSRAEKDEAIERMKREIELDRTTV